MGSQRVGHGWVTSLPLFQLNVGLVYFLQSHMFWTGTFLLVDYNTKTLVLNVDFEFERGMRVIPKTGNVPGSTLFSRALNDTWMLLNSATFVRCIIATQVTHWRLYALCEFLSLPSHGLKWQLQLAGERQLLLPTCFSVWQTILTIY